MSQKRRTFFVTVHPLAICFVASVVVSFQRTEKYASALFSLAPRISSRLRAVTLPLPREELERGEQLPFFYVLLYLILNLSLGCSDPLSIGSGSTDQESSLLALNAPTNLVISGGVRDSSLFYRLSWKSSLEDGGGVIQEHQYRYKVEEGDFGEWINIPNSRVGGAQEESYEITSDFTEGYVYTFQVRSLNESHSSPPTSEASLADGELFLQESDDPYQFFLFYQEGSWNWICDEDFNDKAANVSCRQLGYKEAKGFEGRPPLSDREIFRFPLSCVGIEDRFIDCPLIQTEQEDSSSGDLSQDSLSENSVSSQSPLRSYQTLLELRQSQGSCASGQVVFLACEAFVVAPSRLVTTPGNSQVSLTWLPSTDDSIAKYQYRKKMEEEDFDPWLDIPDSEPSGIHVNDYIVTGLINDIPYIFEVRAVNSEDQFSFFSNQAMATPIEPSLPSAPAAPSLPPTSADPSLSPSVPAPGVVANLMARANNSKKIDLSWEAPMDKGGNSDITGYKVEASTNGSTFFVLVADTRGVSRTYTHTGLSPKSTHHYRVSAINSMGIAGAASQVTHATTLALPILGWARPLYESLEEGGHVTVRITLNRASDEAISVNYATRDDTALSGQDYRAIVATSVTFAPGETEKTFQVKIMDDLAVESQRETFRLTLSGWDPRVIRVADAQGESSVVVSIMDTDAAEFTVEPQTVDEGCRTTQVRVAWTQPVAVPVSYNTRDGSAKAGSDYFSSNGVLTLPIDQRERLFPITIVDDNLEEESETFEFVLALPPSVRERITWTNGGVGSITINDNEALNPPTNVLATSTEPTWIGLSWSAPENLPSDFLGYQVEVSENGNSGWSALVENYPLTSYSHADLEAQSTRYYRVASVDPSRLSAFSSVVNTSTSEIGVNNIKLQHGKNTDTLASGDVDVVTAVETVNSASVVSEKKSICNHGWSLEEGSAVCRQLGYPGVFETTLRSHFGEYLPAYFILKNFACTGEEARLVDCPGEDRASTCHFSERGGVICQKEAGIPVITIEADSLLIVEGSSTNFVLTRTGGELTRRFTVNLSVSDTSQSIRGSAPTKATFAASESTVILGIATTDDSVVQQSRTIRVKLATDNGYTLYKLGTPSTAEQTVIDNDGDTLPPPTNVSATSTEPTWIGLSWSTPENLPSDFLGYQVEVSENGTSGWSALAENYPLTSYSHADLEVQSMRYYRVASVYSSGLSIFSSVVNTSTSEIGVNNIKLQHGKNTDTLASGDVDVVTAVETVNSASIVSEKKSICNHGWSLEEGSVVCRQLGYPGVFETTLRSHFGEYLPAYFVLKNFACTGEEARLVDCPGEDRASTCHFSERGGVICQKEAGIPVITIEASSSSVTEGGGAAFTLTRIGGNLARTFTVNLSISETAQMISGSTSTTVTFRASEAIVIFNVATEDDFIPEQNSTIRVSLAEDNGYTLYKLGSSSEAEKRVLDND